MPGKPRTNKELADLLDQHNDLLARELGLEGHPAFRRKKRLEEIFTDEVMRKMNEDIQVSEALGSRAAIKKYYEELHVKEAVVAAKKKDVDEKAVVIEAKHKKLDEYRALFAQHPAEDEACRELELAYFERAEAKVAKAEEAKREAEEELRLAEEEVAAMPKRVIEAAKKVSTEWTRR